MTPLGPRRFDPHVRAGNTQRRHYVLQHPVWAVNTEDTRVTQGSRPRSMTDSVSGTPGGQWLQLSTRDPGLYLQRLTEPFIL